MIQIRDNPFLLKKCAPAFILLFVLSLPVSIAAAEICLTVLFALIVITFRGHRLSDAGVITVPIILYSGFSMISAIFSLNLEHSLEDIKSLVLFATPFLITYFKDSVPRLKTIVAALYVGAVPSALYALYQYWTTEGERATGFMSHWMTFAEQMMLIGGVAFAFVLFDKGRWRWISALVMIVLAAGCVASLTRSSWLAVLAGVAVLVAIRKPILTLAIPVGIVVFLALAPSEIRGRALSVVNPYDTSNRNRLLMVKSGLYMVRDHPLLGVGPDVVGLVYPQYMDPRATPGAVHLHNNIIQIAAERGLPTLAAWLWLMVAAAVASFRLLRRSPAASAFAAAALFAVVGMFVSGLFEFNFEDSEVKLLFLFILTVMFLARDGHGMPREKEPEPSS
ncbi:MAG: O-antigen ligase family protein [Acidobacteriota bacterium]